MTIKEDGIEYIEELLVFINENIKRLNCKKRYTVDENGEEIECFDGEGIYLDGCIDGEIKAYYNMKRKLSNIYLRGEH